MSLQSIMQVQTNADGVVSRCFGIAVRIHRTGGRWTAVHPAEVASR